MSHARRIDLACMLGLFAASLALRLVYARGFDGLYGQDAYAYYNFAGDLRTGDALKPFFWPLGYPALLTVGFALFGGTPATAQAISLVLGAALAALVYGLARQVGAGAAGALAAGLMMAECGQAIQSSIVVMADIPALFWAALSAVLLLHYLRADSLRWLVLSALALALACVTRWLYLALIPVWGAALLLNWQRVKIRPMLAAATAAALVMLPQVAVSLHSPYPVLDHAWVQGWSPTNALNNRFDNVDGHFVYPQINALFYAQAYADPYYLAPLFTPFVLAGAWALRRRATGALLVGWAVLPYLFLTGIPYQNVRFPLIVFPAAAVLAGVGLAQVLRRRMLFGLVLAAGLGLTLMASQPTITEFVRHQQVDKRAVQWALAHVPEQTRLYTFELTEPLEAYAGFEVRELFDETTQSMDAQLADGTPSYLFANVWVIENTWAGRELDRTYQWLRDSVGLEYLGRIGNYWLFRIRNEYWHTVGWVQRPPG